MYMNSKYSLLILKEIMWAKYAQISEGLIGQTFVWYSKL